MAQRSSSTRIERSWWTRVCSGPQLPFGCSVFAAVPGSLLPSCGGRLSSSAGQRSKTLPYGTTPEQLYQSVEPSQQQTIKFYNNIICLVIINITVYIHFSYWFWLFKIKMLVLLDISLACALLREDKTMIHTLNIYTLI